MEVTGLAALLSAIAVIVCEAQVIRVGNEIYHSLSGVDIVGATFLTNDIVEVEGKLFAYQAYFRSDKPVRFQIWRPVDSDGNFKLISDTRVVPSVVNGIEDIYIPPGSNSCVFVRPGDRIGLSIEGSPGAVAYVFDPAGPTDFRTSLDPSHPLDLNTIISFDSLTFPYDFSVAAFIDTDLSRHPSNTDDLHDCPTDLYIPGRITEKPSVTTESVMSSTTMEVTDELTVLYVSTEVPYDMSTKVDNSGNPFSNLFNETKDYILLGVVGGLVLIVIIVAIACTIAKRRVEEDTVVKVIERLPTLPDVEWLTNNPKSYPNDAIWNAPIYNDHLISRYNAVPSDTSTPIAGRPPPLNPDGEDDDTWQGSLKMRWDSAENIDETRTESTHCPDNLSVTISEGPFLEGRTSC